MDLLQLLEAMGYKIFAAGQDSFPCSITKDSVPIGFLNENLELSCIPGTEKNHELIQSVIEYSKENFGRHKIFEEQFLISQYENYFLTSNFDMEEQRPIYHVYKKPENDFTCQELCNGTSKEEVVKQFVEESGLSKELYQKPKEKTEVTQSHENKQNIPSLTQNPAEKIMAEPSPFQKLKGKLHEFGFRLKIAFSGQELFSKIYQDTQTVGVLDQGLNVTYTKNISPQIQQKVDQALKTVKTQPIHHVTIHKKHKPQKPEKPSVKQEIQSMKKVPVTVKPKTQEKSVGR